MRQIDDMGYKLCNYQADLFEHSATQTDCSSLVFVKQFMSSNIASRMDEISFLFEAIDVPQCLDELAKEKKLSQGSEKYPSYILSWIGYIYRYIAYTREISSRVLFTIVNTKDLYAVYEAYHSLDPEEATIRILESAGTMPNDPVNHMEIAKKILL